MMFEKAVFTTLEVEPRTRAWTTLVSFAMQMVAVGLLILLPLIYTEAIPNLHINEAPAVPPAPRTPDHVKIIGVERHDRVRHYDPTKVVAPGTVPNHVDMTPDPPRPPEVGDVEFPAGVPGGDPNLTAQKAKMWARMLPPAPMPVEPKPVVAPTHRPPSVLLEGNLVKRVKPLYPAAAKTARIQGTVVLKAIIDAQGRVEHLQAVSGNPLLMAAAVDAVSQWRYCPYVLNGTPIEVETQVTVIFTLR